MSTTWLFTEMGQSLQRHYLPCSSWEQQWGRGNEQNTKVQVPASTKKHDTFSHHYLYYRRISWEKTVYGVLTLKQWQQCCKYHCTHLPNTSNVYHWIKFTPFHPSQFDCSYNSAFSEMNKPLNCHLWELLHRNGNYYDLIITSTDSHSPEPSLSGSFFVEAISDS